MPELGCPASQHERDGQWNRSSGNSNAPQPAQSSCSKSSSSQASVTRGFLAGRGSTAAAAAGGSAAAASAAAAWAASRAATSGGSSAPMAGAPPPACSSAAPPSAAACCAAGAAAGAAPGAGCWARCGSAASSPPPSSSSPRALRAFRCFLACCLAASAASAAGRRRGKGGGGGALGSEWDDRRSGQLARDAQQPAGVARERQQGGRSLPAVEARRASSASCSSCFSAGSLATSAGVCPCLLWAAGSALRASSTSTVSRCPAGRQAGGRHAGGESREGPRLAAGQLAGPSGQAAAWAAGRPSAAVCAACTRTLAGRQVQRVLARPQLSINLDACRVGEGGEGSKVTAHVGLATAGWRARWLAGAPAGWLRAARAAAVVKHTGAATPRAAGRPPSFSSHLMTGACPLSAAKCRAFMSSWAAAPGCAPAASSAFTPSRCPAYAARCSAVRRCRQAGTHEAAGRQG